MRLVIQPVTEALRALRPHTVPSQWRGRVFPSSAPPATPLTGLGVVYGLGALGAIYDFMGAQTDQVSIGNRFDAFTADAANPYVARDVFANAVGDIANFTSDQQSGFKSRIVSAAQQMQSDGAIPPELASLMMDAAGEGLFVYLSRSPARSTQPAYNAIEKATVQALMDRYGLTQIKADMWAIRKRKADTAAEQTARSVAFWEAVYVGAEIASGKVLLRKVAEKHDEFRAKQEEYNKAMAEAQRLMPPADFAKLQAENKASFSLAAPYIAQINKVVGAPEEKVGLGLGPLAVVAIVAIAAAVIALGIVIALIVKAIERTLNATQAFSEAEKARLDTEEGREVAAIEASDLPPDEKAAKIAETQDKYRAEREKLPKPSGMGTLVVLLGVGGAVLLAAAFALPKLGLGKKT